MLTMKSKGRFGAAYDSDFECTVRLTLNVSVGFILKADIFNLDNSAGENFGRVVVDEILGLTFGCEWWVFIFFRAG